MPGGHFTLFEQATELDPWPLFEWHSIWGKSVTVEQLGPAQVYSISYELLPLPRLSTPGPQFENTPRASVSELMFATSNARLNECVTRRNDRQRQTGCSARQDNTRSIHINGLRVTIGRRKRMVSGQSRNSGPIHLANAAFAPYERRREPAKQGSFCTRCTRLKAWTGPVALPRTTAGWGHTGRCGDVVEHWRRLGTVALHPGCSTPARRIK
jgi:hypothetical protein